MPHFLLMCRGFIVFTVGNKTSKLNIILVTYRTFISIQIRLLYAKAHIQYYEW